MGGGIAEVAAKGGCDVVVVEVSEERARASRDAIGASLDRAAAKGKLSEADRDAALDRLEVVTDYAALADRRIVIEAVVESEAEKLRVFAELDRTVRDEDAILASNTSSIPIARLASATDRPDHVLGLHFFNPVPVLKLVELIPSLRTAEAVADRAEAFAAEVLGKRVIRCPDRAGFVVNALLVPYLLSAIRLYEQGLATAEDIDAGMVEGCNHPMGPLRLTDLIGLDTTKAVAESLYEEFREPTYATPPLLARMVDAGFLGRKSGRGFYDYR